MIADFEPGEQSSHCDIICPHCGWSRKAEPCDGDADENPSEHKCEECGKPFLLYAAISITYYTQDKEDKL